MFQQDQTTIKNQVLIWSRDLTEIRGSETVAYYKLENEKGSVDAKQI